MKEQKSRTGNKEMEGYKGKNEKSKGERKLGTHGGQKERMGNTKKNKCIERRE